jgi:hypothetical protein
VTGRGEREVREEEKKMRVERVMRIDAAAGT